MKAYYIPQNIYILSEQFNPPKVSMQRHSLGEIHVPPFKQGKSHIAESR